MLSILDREMSVKYGTHERTNSVLQVRSAFGNNTVYPCISFETFNLNIAMELNLGTYRTQWWYAISKDLEFSIITDVVMTAFSIPGLHFSIS